MRKEKCEDCHFYFEGQYYPACHRYPREVMAFSLGHCHEFRPKHDCKKFESFIMERDGEAVYECCICKQVRIDPFAEKIKRSYYEYKRGQNE